MERIIASFKGKSVFNLDSKGRIQIPSNFRAQMSFDDDDHKPLVMTKGPNSCIYIFMQDVFDKYKQKIDDLQVDKKKKLRQLRKLADAIESCNIDANWRVRLPDVLLEYAQIDKEVLIMGMFDKIELWNPDKFNEYLDQDDKDVDSYDFDDFTTDVFVE
jgi:MraZ protein